MSQSSRLNNAAISSCMVGVKCRYDGESSKHFFPDYQDCLHFCPEVLGGLSVPRIPCEIDKGDGTDVLLGRAKVLGSDGKDYTKAFLAGAQQALELCLDNNIERVVLKDKSPSCGVYRIYIDGTLVAGMGVTAAMLSAAGIEIVSEEEV